MSDVAVEEDPLEPVREQVRKMIESKKKELREHQEHAASLHARAAEVIEQAQTSLFELRGLELALRRLGGAE